MLLAITSIVFSTKNENIWFTLIHYSLEPNYTFNQTFALFWLIVAYSLHEKIKTKTKRNNNIINQNYYSLTVKEHLEK